MGNVYIYEDLAWNGKFIRLPIGDYTEDRLRVLSVENLDGTMSSVRVEEGGVLELTYDNGDVKTVIGPEQIENLTLLNIARLVGMRVRAIGQSSDCTMHMESGAFTRNLGMGVYTNQDIVGIERVELTPHTLAVLYDSQEGDRSVAIMGPRVIDDFTVLGLPSDEVSRVEIYGLMDNTSRPFTVPVESAKMSRSSEEGLGVYDSHIEYAESLDTSAAEAVSATDLSTSTTGEHPELKGEKKTPKPGVYNGGSIKRVTAVTPSKKISFFTVAVFLFVLVVLISIMLCFNYYSRPGSVGVGMGAVGIEPTRPNIDVGAAAVE